MMRHALKRDYSGTKDISVREYETRHRQVARRAAAAGMVLLKNENETLPISDEESVALYGAGALHLSKGGTGSGDVNQREVVEVYEGLKNAGIHIANEDWLEAYEKEYAEAREKWRQELLAKSVKEDHSDLFIEYAANPLRAPLGPAPSATATDLAIFCLTRTSGEGADRKNVPGDFLLTDEEYSFISRICNLYDRVVLVLNTGGLIDLSFTEDFTNIDSILYMSQPGMEGGNALADVLTGKVTPSGKLTDTWAYSYEDYPGAKEYSSEGSSLEYATYHEGIYVGYRYFDSFNKSVRYGFGFGLSYTRFCITTEGVELRDRDSASPRVAVRVRVENIGTDYSGSEVVQVYVSSPDGRIAKEMKRLVAFAKTDILAPGQVQFMTIEFPIDMCTSYSYDDSGYVLEEGYYGVWVGSSEGDSSVRGLMRMDNGIVLTRCDHICPPKKKIKEIEQTELTRSTRYKSWVEKARQRNVPVINISDVFSTTETIEYGKRSFLDPEAYDMAMSLDIDELVKMTTADLKRGEMHTDNFIGASGASVPGSAAETCTACEDKGIGSMVLSDGPAGLRLDQYYYVNKDGRVIQRSFMEKVEGGLFVTRDDSIYADCEKYYQFCTAFPVGTMLAQTWDTDIVSEVGEAVSEEMLEFNTSLWLAPGMNIHRNPLCGRNFEYYSEDPVVSGIMAAAMTLGVQKNGGCGTTIKHFVCNNQEENRMGCDSRVSERALREIYLKGFEICVKSSQPMSVMTSYNLVNGVHTANSYDLCTKVLRDEWGFEGLIMTDWTTTEQGDDCTAAGCMRAGNDLVCPGNESDHKNIKEELIDYRLSQDEIRRCVARLIATAWKSNIYEGALPYTERFAGKLKDYLTVTREEVQNAG